MKKECKIIQDLLPNYLENVTNEETNNFIKEHISNCNECNEIYNSMKENLQIETLNTAEEINYLKKFKIKLSLLRNILILVVIIIILIVARKIIIFNSLISKANKTMNIDNYYSKSISYDDKATRILEKYHKDEIDLSTLELYPYSKESAYTKYTFYDNQVDKLFIQENEKGTKVSSSEGMALYSDIRCLNNDITDAEDYLKYIFTSSINKVNFKGIECYLIKINNIEIFIDASTGLRVKYIDNNLNLTQDTYYEFGTVSDSDVAKPTVSEN